MELDESGRLVRDRGVLQGGGPTSPWRYTPPSLSKLLSFRNVFPVASLERFGVIWGSILDSFRGNFGDVFASLIRAWILH